VAGESPLPEGDRASLKAAGVRRKMLLPKIIGRFKMNSAKDINTVRGSSGNSFWQRNYYEHIIRDGKDLYPVR
jgi:REP element-mobilizing transposase RayT